MTQTKSNSSFRTLVLLVAALISLSSTTTKATVTIVDVQYQPHQVFPEFPCIYHLNTAVGCHVNVYLKNTGAGSVTVTDATPARYGFEDGIGGGRSALSGPSI